MKEKEKDVAKQKEKELNSEIKANKHRLGTVPKDIRYQSFGKK